MIEYRIFRNPDPPLLCAVWNASISGQRAIPLRSATLLEYFTLAKPYFDPNGMILALDAGTPVGVAHAGFAGNAQGTALDTSVGVLCQLTVVPAYRRQGIGAELLRRCEQYLRNRGAKEILAGPMPPRNPFLFGLYGGCDVAGFLASDSMARPFLEKRGYQVIQTIGLFQRAMEPPAPLTDPRFPAIRQQYDIIAAPYSQAGWWQESVLGPVEAVEYRLQDKHSDVIVARAILWDMETFGPQWNQACVGMVNLYVEPELRRRGLARYLVAQILRHLRDQPFHLFEASVLLDNTAGVELLRSLSFAQVESGHSYRLTRTG